jgi:hypothetical protein
MKTEKNFPIPKWNEKKKKKKCISNIRSNINLRHVVLVLNKK